MDQIDEFGIVTTLVHFVYEAAAPPSDDLPEGPPSPQWRIACMPNMVELHATAYHPNYQRTDDPRAVTCPACKKTRSYEQSRKWNE